MDLGNEPRVLLTVRLSNEHWKQSRTTHTSNGLPVPRPAVLKIATFDPSNGFYILHFDKDGNELTDTFHKSIAQALDQAKLSSK